MAGICSDRNYIDRSSLELEDVMSQTFCSVLIDCNKLCFSKPDNFIVAFLRTLPHQYCARAVLVVPSSTSETLHRIARSIRTSHKDNTLSLVVYAPLTKITWRAWGWSTPLRYPLVATRTGNEPSTHPLCAVLCASSASQLWLKQARTCFDRKESASALHSF